MLRLCPPGIPIDFSIPISGILSRDGRHAKDTAGMPILNSRMRKAVRITEVEHYLLSREGCIGIKHQSSICYVTRGALRLFYFTLLSRRLARRLLPPSRPLRCCRLLLLFFSGKSLSTVPDK